MSKRRAGVLVLALLACLTTVGPADAKLVVMDAMESPRDWDLAKDKTVSGAINQADGPEGQKALEFRYELIGGNWLAFFRKLPNGTPGLQAITFQYRGEGANNFEIKLTDDTGATYGIHMPPGTNCSAWTKVVVPVNNLEYRFGGSNKPPHADNFRRIEFTVSAGAGGVGRVLISNLQYSTDPLAAVVPPKPESAGDAAPVAGETKRKRDTKGWPAPQTIVIKSEKAWQMFIDQGASARLYSAEGPATGQKAVGLMYTWGLREIPNVQQATGSWLAIVTDVRMDMSEVRKISFPYKNTGAITNLEVKIHDQDGAVYGRKISSGNAMTKWTTISVSRSEMKYLWGGDGSGKFDWSHVIQVEIALSRAGDSRDSGTFHFGNISFESANIPLAPSAAAALTSPEAEAPVSSVAETVAGQVKISIDDFTDLNPTNRYYVIAGDDSSMLLQASRLTFETDYSLSMRYTLSSTRPTGSWVEAQRRFAPTLNWKGTEAVKIWVRGDGSRNIFRMTILDGEGNQWIYNNEDVLASSDWYLVSVPISSFTLFQDIYRRGAVTGTLKDHLQAIKALSVSVLSQPNRSSRNTGEVFVENLYIVGKGINAARAVPLAEKPPVGIAIPLKNWNIGGASETRMETTPANGNALTQNINFHLMGNFEKFSVLGEIKTESTFGNDADGIRSESGTVVSPNMNFTLLNPIEGISDVMVGNLWFNADPAIFANDNLYGGWGFKGILAEGWIDQLHHRTYYMKHAPNSFSLAGDYAFNWKTLNLNLVATYFNQSPFVVNATRLESDDTAFLLSASDVFTLPKWFTTVVRLQGGYDWYQKYWDTGTQQPMNVYEGGGIFAGELNITEMDKIFWPGLSLTGKYSYVDTNYKPTFRQHPGYWDVECGDQKGMSLKLYQTVAGAFLSAEYNKFNRVSNSKQYLEKTLISIGYNNWQSLDVTLTEEFATKVYHFTDTRYLVDGAYNVINDDRNEINTTLYLAYHFNSTLVLSEWMQFKRNQSRLTEDRYNQLFSTTRLTYYIATNISFSVENKFSHLGPVAHADEPLIDPTDPEAAGDYTRIRLDLAF